MEIKRNKTSEMSPNILTFIYYTRVLSYTPHRESEMEELMRGRE